MDALFNWRRRALRAENRLRKLGEPVTGLPMDDDFYLVNTLEHQNSDIPPSIDELNAARERLRAAGRG